MIHTLHIHIPLCLLYEIVYHQTPGSWKLEEHVKFFYLLLTFILASKVRL